MPSDQGTTWTTDHATIRRWVVARGGRPARVRGTGGRADAGLLRIDFPGFGDEDALEEIAWDEWFRKFDESNLAFLYQDGTAGKEESRWSKLVDRSEVEEAAGQR
jgi:hypothetical protein